MNDMDKFFPKFQKKIEDLIEDEEGNVPGSKLLMMGTMIVVLGSLLSLESFAKHSSHKSHSSHSSHSSGSSSYHSSHESHESHSSHESSSHYNSHSDHGSHESHESHQSHTSHSNTTAHSNSLYSSEGDVRYSAPAASEVQGITAPPVEAAEDTFVLPEVNQNIQLPNGTPITSIMPSFAVPASSVDSKIDAGNINTPSATDKVQ